MAETSTKPYLVRALYEWCCDNGYTPYLAVSVDAQTRVPIQYVKNGEIVLNVSPSATHQLTMGNDWIEFQARFAGVAQTLAIPIGNVTAIYARETGHGMAFEVTAPPLAEVPAPAADDELARRRQSDARRRDGGDRGERGDGERTRPGRPGPDAAEADGGTTAGGAEVIAFGPDAARRRRRDEAEPGGREGQDETSDRPGRPERIEPAGRADRDGADRDDRAGRADGKGRGDRSDRQRGNGNGNGNRRGGGRPEAAGGGATAHGQASIDEGTSDDRNDVRRGGAVEPAPSSVVSLGAPGPDRTARRGAPAIDDPAPAGQAKDGHADSDHGNGDRVGSDRENGDRGNGDRGNGDRGNGDRGKGDRGKGDDAPGGQPAGRPAAGAADGSAEAAADGPARAEADEANPRSGPRAAVTPPPAEDDAASGEDAPVVIRVAADAADGADVKATDDGISAAEPRRLDRAPTPVDDPLADPPDDDGGGGTRRPRLTRIK